MSPLPCSSLVRLLPGRRIFSETLDFLLGYDIMYPSGEGNTNQKTGKEMNMRVTKTIRDYIEKEVRARIQPKYDAEKAEAERRFAARDAFFDKCAKAAEEAFNAAFEANFHDVSDFMEDVREADNSPVSFYDSRAALIPDRVQRNSVYQWQNRMNAEVNKITTEIAVELELGGTKAELMAMLEKIGK